MIIEDIGDRMDIIIKLCDKCKKRKATCYSNIGLFCFDCWKKKFNTPIKEEIINHECGVLKE